MVLVVCHTERLALAVRAQTRHWENVLLVVNASVVAERERPVQRGVLNRTPEIDNLEAIGEELRDVGRRKMAVYACDRRPGRLVNVGLRDGLALARRVLLVAWRAVPEGWKNTYC